MYLVVLGCGLIGPLVAKELVAREEVTKVLVADVREDAARKVASELGKKVVARKVDASNTDEVAKLVEGADAVIDCVRAAYQYGASNVKAAIKAGVNLANLSDDADATLAMLEMDADARKAGITVIPSIGGAPGLSDLCAKYGAAKLDRTDEIHHAWIQNSAIGYMGSRHMDHCLSGKVLQYRDGKLIEVAPFTDRETVEFLYGKGDVYNAGHPEPVLLSRYIPGVKTVTEKCGFVPENMNIAYRGLYEYGLTGKTPAITIGGVKITPTQFLDAYRGMMSHEQKVEFWPAPPPSMLGFAQRIEVKGMKGGFPARYTYQYLAEHYEMGTAYPITVAALMLARGEIKTKGVIGPEGCLDPASFLAEMAKKGIVFYEIEENMRKV